MTVINESMPATELVEVAVTKLIKIHFCMFYIQQKKGYMYILRCANGQYYTGSTIDIERRLWEHNKGMGANFTKKHLPVEIVYLETYDKISDAFKREKQVQGWSHSKKEALINGDYEKLKYLAKGNGCPRQARSPG